MIDVIEVKTDKKRKTKKAFPTDVLFTFSFGMVETMKQGFAENGNCWIMGIAVLAIVYSAWRLRMK